MRPARLGLALGPRVGTAGAAQRRAVTAVRRGAEDAMRVAHAAAQR